MFAARMNATKAYHQVGVETGVTAASPHKLIVMLFEGALLAITNARMQMEQKRIPEKEFPFHAPSTSSTVASRPASTKPVAGNSPQTLTRFTTT